jgi:ribonucleoside-diphosphate reductase alpha chain
MTPYQQFIAMSRYARYIPEEGRRETWPETVQRYVDFWGDKIDDETRTSLYNAIKSHDVMPSMRCLMTAGAALERDNVAGFNCSYLPIDHPRSFDELMYILLCGTGVGFSVERQYVQKLPTLPESFHPTDTTIVVPDSKIGWAKSFRQLVAMLYAGEIPKWDVSKVRAAGEPLKTFGGRASGPAPLVDLFNFTVDIFTKADNDKLTSLECHDLCCKIAEVIVVGGVRRSALISLSNPSDGRLRNAKSGRWDLDNGQRGLANNSACYTERPEFDFFLDEMRSLYESKSGERGIFSRTAAQKVAGASGRRDTEWDFGTNPCSEIILRPNQFCNLSEVVVRRKDTLSSLKEKVRRATILGTLQATLVDFRYLRSVWKTNTEEEALLGVSLTGIMDNPTLADADKAGKWLRALKEVAIETNKEWAKKLGINPATAITCVKPSGTVSQLVDSASGIHPRFSSQYIRTVRQDIKDPLTTYMINAGVPHEPDVYNPQNVVFSFPVKAPDGSVTAGQMGSMDQLRLWKVYQDEWCEHKPSMTCYYNEDSFLAVAQWVWDNFDSISGVSFLPIQEHSYQQAPYQEITREEYDAFPKVDVDFSAFREEQDNTESSQSLACVGGSCEIL